MIRRRRLLVCVCLTIMIVVGTFAWVAAWREYASLQSWLNAEHLRTLERSLRVGMSRNDVLKILGPPAHIYRQQKSLRLWFGENSGNVINVLNVAFLYRDGVDYHILVVFDDEGRVMNIHSGGT